MTSATVAVTLSAFRRGQRLRGRLCSALVSAIFVYTTVVTVIEQPEGLKIAALFIAAIIVTSLLSRLWRQTELRRRRTSSSTRLHNGSSKRRPWDDSDHRTRHRQAADVEHYAERKDTARSNHMPADDPDPVSRSDGV